MSFDGILHLYIVHPLLFSIFIHDRIGLLDEFVAQRYAHTRPTSILDFVQATEKCLMLFSRRSVCKRVLSLLSFKLQWSRLRCLFISLPVEVIIL